MKKKLLIIFSITTLVILGLLLNTNNNSVNDIDKLREQHIAFLDNSPYKETVKLPKAERKAKGIPANAYFERQYELTLDPSTGRPHPEKIFATQKVLAGQFARVPGENTNAWEERGPNNVGGRTRAMMYDPNDAGGTRVFAGGVSGGLWVNDDITDVNSAWSEVDIPQNLGISAITYDPNNTDIFYVGTGETYFGGGGQYGNGVWQSQDGGLSWAQIFGGDDDIIIWQADASVIVNSPGSIAGDYPAVLATNFGDQLGSDLTGDLVLALDGVGVSEDACEALTNSGDLSGKIAVIRRGDCSFVSKINKAQTAGAIGVILVNNIAGNPVGMGGTDAGITIPTVMLGRENGNILIAQLGAGVNVTLTRNDVLVSGSSTNGVRFINDIVVRDVGTTSEVFVATGSAFFYNGSETTWYSLESSGLYRSDNEGTSFTQISLPDTASGLPLQPNDLEISADNTVWMSTRHNRLNNQGGGLIFSSSDGTAFTQKYAVTNGLRTEIEASGTNANTFYVLSTLSAGNPLFFAKTINGFGRVSNIGQPQDDDPAPRVVGDFTGGQGGYDLLLALDPTDDAKVYVGGINLYGTSDSGINWDQLSHWYGGFGYQEVHSDQHTLIFDPNDASKGMFSNDGGVYYASSLSSGTSGIDPRNNNYNTLQFYKGAIGQEVGSEKLLAGAQDNGSQLINNAPAGISGSNEIRGGDGAYVFIDRDNEYMIASYIYNSYSYHSYATGSTVYTIAANQNDGDFINPTALDSDNNILYSNGTDAVPTYQIYRYALGTNSAVRSTLTDALLTRAPSAFKPSTFTTTTLFVGTEDGKLLKLLNANASPTWSDISGSDFVGSISCIELGATEDDIYVTFYNYGVPSIFYSNNGGTTWQNKENNLPDLPVRAVLANPLNEDEVILGTELGVWGTSNFTDANPIWHQAQNGMKDVQVTSFDLRTADNTVLATTHGRGMFTGQFDADASGLSVDEFSENDLIKIYPTVSDGNITISPNSEIREGNIAVFDINGRNVHSTKVNFDNGLEQPLSLNLSSGMYIVKFAANGLQSSHKIIIE